MTSAGRTKTFLEQGLLIILLTTFLYYIYIIYQHFHHKDERDFFANPTKIREPPHLDIVNNVKIKRLPQAIIIGVKKCGTGTLKMFANIQPQLIVKQSEPHFFDDLRNYKKGFGWYINSMPKSSTDQITMEGSPRYFVDPNTPQAIQRVNASIKLILIVRDPSKRLISDYAHWKARKSSYPNFTELVFDENGNINILYDPVSMSMYAKHLRKWYALFPKSNILILDGDNLSHKPWEELQKLEKFLHLKSFFKKQHFIFSKKKGFYCLNKSGNPECQPPGKGRSHPYVSPDQMKRIRYFYKPYNEDFFKLTGLHFNWNAV